MSPFNSFQFNWANICSFAQYAGKYVGLFAGTMEITEGDATSAQLKTSWNMPWFAQFKDRVNDMYSLTVSKGSMITEIWEEFEEEGPRDEFTTGGEYETEMDQFFDFEFSTYPYAGGEVSGEGAEEENTERCEGISFATVGGSTKEARSLFSQGAMYSERKEYDLFMDMDGCGKSMADSTMIVDYPMNPEERFVCGEDQSEVSERASEVSERAEPHTNQPTRFLSLGAG